MNTNVKTSISISNDLFKEIESIAKGQQRSITELVEKGMRDYLTKLMREKRDARDIEIINRNAEELNKEALESLEYQVDIWNEENFTKSNKRQNKTEKQQIF
jgi:metal-responsive CopG/Arc/MetJ family transcriptional regulator